MTESPQSQPELSVSPQNVPTLEKSPHLKRLPHNAYTIGWLCALPKEQTAAIAMLDEEHESLPVPPNDHNVYTLGSVWGHNVVIACLPNMGTNSAATAAASIINTFQSIRFGLMVGIGGGIPSKVSLGDVVVSQPVASYHGVVQWDMGKVEQGGKLIQIGSLNRPPNVLLNACNRLKSNHEMSGSKINEYVCDVEKKFPRLAPKYTSCESLQDPLLASETTTVRQAPEDAHFMSVLLRAIIAIVAYLVGLLAFGAANEEDGRLPEGTERAGTTRELRIHYGLIASGNRVVKDAQLRDSLDEAFGGHLLCVEMEAAGLMNDFPCIVIRGICDYADSGKEKTWQEYAAIVAAAYAKELLGCVQPSIVDAEDLAKAMLDKVHNVHKQIDSVQQLTAEMKADTDSIKSDMRIQMIKGWLDPPDPSTNANHARTLHHEGTGMWLLENPVFQSWHLGSRRQIWLHGLAGCGKTVLSTTVLHHIAKGNEDPILNFFFDFSDTKKQTYQSMLRSLAFQLYQSGIHSNAAMHLDLSFQAHQNGKEQPKTETLWAVISKMLSAQKRVFIVLDALDESTSRGNILKWVEEIMFGPELAHVQLLYTSRPESEFLHHIPTLIGQEGCVPLDKQAVNSDIRSWVSAQLSQRRDFTRKRLSQSLLEEIRMRVGNGADGMFRWAFCQLESLSRCLHEAAMEDALISLPKNLDETYERMIKSIPPERKMDAIRLLQFLVHSKRPLTLAEAKDVIATQIEDGSRGFDTKRRLFCETDVLDYCSGLATIVYIRTKVKVLHLAHFSVKEYLLRDSNFKTATANISLTRTCLTYLSDIQCSDEEIRRNFPMARYAAKFWPDHATLIETPEDMTQEIVSFLEEEVTFQRWSRLYDMRDSNPSPTQDSRIYYACLTGLVAPLRELIGKGADVNGQDIHHCSPLQAASLGGHEEIVKLLLDNGADVNAQDDFYGSALQTASGKGHQKIVELLLDQGADVNAQGGYYGNALRSASEEGYQDVVKLLLEKGAAINVQGDYYGSAFQAALLKGHQEIVKLLLDKGADVNERDSFHGSALQIASGNGHQEIVKLLLDKGADVNTYDYFYVNAPQPSLEICYREMVARLLHDGPYVNARGGNYGNALQVASRKGHQDIVELLLDRGADVNAQNEFYASALQNASEKGHQGIVELLLDKGAGINAEGGKYGDALRVASEKGHQKIVELLLNKGAGGQGFSYGAVPPIPGKGSKRAQIWYTFLG